jgi:DNA-binding transcriptional ArsR family regulator
MSKPSLRPFSNQRVLDAVARRFRLLGEPYRLRILQLLEDGERSVGEITAALGGNQPNVSKHLQALYDGGLVGRRRGGNSIFYFIADPNLFKLCDLVCRSTARSVQSHLKELLAGPNA